MLRVDQDLHTIWPKLHWCQTGKKIDIREVFSNNI